MTEETKCPACRKSLYLPGSSLCNEDIVMVSCNNCHYRYAVSYATTHSFNSDLLNFSSTKLLSKTKQKKTYQLEVDFRSESKKKFKFETFNLKESFTTKQGDRLLLLYTVKKTNKFDLVLLKNLDQNCEIQIFFPRKQQLIKAAKTTSMTMVGGVTLTLIDSLYPVIANYLVLLGTIPLALATGIYSVSKYHKKYQELATNNLTRLTSEQNILAKLIILTARLKQLTQNKDSEELLLNRFKLLQVKMNQTDAHLYRDRLITINRGISALEQQLNISQNLINGYSQLINIWEIEYETSQLAEQLPGQEKVEAQVLPRLEELQALEQQKEELSLLIQPAVFLSN